MIFTDFDGTHFNLKLTQGPESEAIVQDVQMFGAVIEWQGKPVD